MKTLRVTTAAGGIFIIENASAFGPDAVIGHTCDNREDRVIRFLDTDIVEEI